MQDDLQAFLGASLGAFRVAADHTWPEWREALVLELVCADGRRCFAKQHKRSEHYAAEVAAYRHWVPALGEHAPRLIASDDRLQALVVSYVAGRRPEAWESPDIQHEAGRLLRIFHDAEDLGPWDDMVADKMARLDYWAARGEGLVDPAPIGAVRAKLKALEGVTDIRRVPCHADYTPRNWLLSGNRLHVIDFGDARPDVWVHDFGRLIFGWHLGKGAQTALFEGYGRRPSTEELEVLLASFAADVVWHIVLAHEHHNGDFAATSLAVLERLVEDVRR